MILQALTDYYRRKAADPQAALAPRGFELKGIPFVIVLARDGSFVSFEDCREQHGKRLLARQFLVPQGVKKTSGVAANLLWDTAEYVLGIDTRGKPERVAEQHRAFVVRIDDCLAAAEDCPELAAVRTLLANGITDEMQADRHWAEIVETNPVVSFRLRAETGLVCQLPAVQDAIAQLAKSDDGAASFCPVLGVDDAPQRLHPAIKGVRDAQSSGANIVSFNLSAFNSFGKEQGYNAPVGEAAAFAYTTALNHLLRRDSPHRFQVGEATTVAWSAESSALETNLGLLFNPPKDDPDALTGAVTSLYASIRNGAYVKDDGEQPFFVLGLSPNNARIAVRFWHVGTVASFSERIAGYFDELDIDGREHYGHPDLFRLLLATAALHKADNINPTLAGALVRAILEDQHYPEALLCAAVRRAAIERDVRYHRAALIKACLCRKYRKSHPPQKELTVSLDTDRTTPGYRLGRLFAVLERAQEAANPGLNATIRERYYSAASTTPGSVFATLLRLSNHHLAKLNPGNQVFYEKLLGEVIDGIGQFPAHLDLNQQGEFAIGYYHQRQALFRKREKAPHADAETTEEPQQGALI